MCGWYCFPKNKFVPLTYTLRAFARQTAPHCRFYRTATTLAFSSYTVVNKSLKPSTSIGPSLVLCLIHYHSPTPSLCILLRFTELIFDLEILQFSTEGCRKSHVYVPTGADPWQRPSPTPLSHWSVLQSCPCRENTQLRH
jgi:hypothetical protein